ncbi:MAG TPA: fibronectin type III domain-containing protein [Kofleriaceae bacterium]
MHLAVRSAVLALLFATTTRAHAGEQCVNVGVQFTPTDSLQIVAWIEDASGNYIDTIYMTAKTGVYGLGNRPGRFDFNSGPYPNPALGIDDMWPYGRRITTFPVWAHKKPETFDSVVFQDGNESNLSHAFDESSPEHAPYCRPISIDGSTSCWNMTDKEIWDTGSCATPVFTDKGKLDSSVKSLYPPRSDVARNASIDSPSVDLYASLNPFDTISRATPKGGSPTEIRWPVPKSMPEGNYVLFVETSKEFDMNATYNETKYPPPVVSYSACGKPYRGQPSVVYRVPFTISTTATESASTDYVGYGDPDGQSGTLFPPDGSITTDTPGSGALRFQLVSDNGMYRVRVKTAVEADYAVPDAPANLRATTIEGTKATLEFVEPGDDGNIGAVTGYDVRIRANAEMTTDNFAESTTVVADVTPVGPGQVAKVDLSGLLPETDYWIGVRAHDDCYNESPVTITKITTANRKVGEVDWCFVATAAYGSVLANDVEMLRRTRDMLLRKTVFGEMFVETYYTFGPAVAGVIGESDLLRASARAVLAPIIHWVRALAY